MKTLKTLFSVDENLQDLEVTDIVEDSRNATQGCMFVAIDGTFANGSKFIKSAIQNGAKFIMQQNEVSSYTSSIDISSNNSPISQVQSTPLVSSIVDHVDNNAEIKVIDGIVYIYVDNVRQQLARICSIFWPITFNKTIAITGTNGKSSTVDIIRQILLYSGINAASIGTLGTLTKDYTIPSRLTSPSSITLHHLFERLNQDKVTHVAMEASSHGLSQYRLDNIEFSVCAFTNFTQDHLDYHHTFESYWKAKERLFSELSTQCFVINADDKQSDILQEIAKRKHIRCISYGVNSKDIQLVEVKEINQFQRVTINWFGTPIEFNLCLAGQFQVYNTLCAMGICYAVGVSIEQILKSIEQLKPINGRLELIGQYNGANIYVDYAHTPDALKNALLSLRNHTTNKLMVVFGCGGNRDQQKRAIMGQIAQQFADQIVITDDNPRSENPQVIRSMILEGCPNATEIPDRKEALKFAINHIQEGDILLVAGKGHEDYQIVAKGKIHFSDKETIKELGNIK